MMRPPCSAPTRTSRRAYRPGPSSTSTQCFSPRRKTALEEISVPASGGSVNSAGTKVSAFSNRRAFTTEARAFHHHRLPDAQSGVVPFGHVNLNPQLPRVSNDKQRRGQLRCVGEHLI